MVTLVGFFGMGVGNCCGFGPTTCIYTMDSTGRANKDA